MKHDKSYYEILEISPKASSEEVYRGYIRAKKVYSQDGPALYSLMDQEECHALLEVIEEAYSILGEPVKRQQYDQTHGLGQEREGRRYHYSSPSKKKDLQEIMSQSRYSLRYKSDEEFEKLVENTTEFTGPLLKKVREYKNININRMADMTKVSKTYIMNIENEDLAGMPPLVYVRGFVYQYAKCLRLNPDLVATSYVLHLKRIKGNAFL